MSANWLLTTRTVSAGGEKTLSAPAMDETLCQTRRVSEHLLHPLSMCCCIAILSFGDSRLRTKSAHCASLKCLISYPAGSEPDSYGSHSSFNWTSWNKGDPGREKYRREKIFLRSRPCLAK